jgi:hypothetical protein
MLDALTSGLAAVSAVTPRPLENPAAPPPVAVPINEPVNLNAPAYVSPSITFDPETNIVVITYRNAETGKVREQYPPPQVVDRYREVDQTGMQNPSLPRTTPEALASSNPPPAPSAAPPADTSPSESTAGSTAGSSPNASQGTGTIA